MAAFGAIAAIFAMLAFFKLLHLEAELSEHRSKLERIEAKLDDLLCTQPPAAPSRAVLSKLSPEAAEFYRKNFGKEPPV